MVAVDSAFRIILVALPPLSRVEPASTSGPTGAAMTMSASASCAASGAQVTKMVAAPRSRA